MLASGSKVGPYEIVAPLGAGGMGEVYRARDSRLNREVAVKVLPGAFAADAERLRRFEQEARLAGALNHPNVLAVYDVGTIEGTPYIVSELLEGVTLRDRMRDGLPLRRALNYAVQIAHGLSAAHERGIVHRDLKPENVFVCRDERVKILDFGLAKEATAASATHDAATMTSSGHTEPGVVLGTQGYMSPEQVRGQKVDGRSDIFAFGAILYEMVSGARAFTGTTSADVMTAILTKEPAEVAIERKVPPTLERILQRCLEKEPERRFQSASDLGFALDSVSAGTETGAARAVEAGKTDGRGKWVVAAIVALGALFAAGFWLRAVGTRPAQTSREIRFTRLTEMAGLEEMPALSPDGKSVAFTADQGGEKQIWVRLLNGGPPVQITHDKGEHLYPRWTRDASAILYYKLPVGNEEQGTIWEVPAMGGPARRLASAISGADVSHDGEHLAFFRINGGKVELVATDRNGSGARVIMSAPPAIEYLYPRWSPDDKDIAYQYEDSVWDDDVYVIPSAGGSASKVTKERTLMSGLGWSEDGTRIVYSSSRGTTGMYLPSMNLWEIPVRGGEPRQLTFGDDSYEGPDIAGSGRVVASRRRMHYDLWRIPMERSPIENAGSAQKVTEQTGKPLTPSISPDGKQIAFLWDSMGHANIWIKDLAGGDMRQLTFENTPEYVVGLPLWNPKEDVIAFAMGAPNSKLPGDDVTYWTVRPDGSELHEVVTSGGWGCWSDDGKWLYYAHTTGPNAQTHSIMRTAAQGGEAETVRNDAGDAPAISPDGKTLYYVLPLISINGSLEYEVRRAQPPDGSSTVVTRIQAGRVPAWQGLNPTLSHDGKWLALPLNDEYGTDIWLLSVADGSLKRATDFGAKRTFIARRVSWAPDDRAIYASVGEGDADVVEVEGLIPTR